MNFPLLSNITVTLCFVDSSITVINNGKDLEAMPNIYKHLINEFYFIKRIPNIRYFTFDYTTKESFHDQWQRGNCDILNNIFPTTLLLTLKAASPDIIATPIVRGSECILVHTARRPTVKDADLGMAVNIIPVQEFVIIISIFAIILFLTSIWGYKNSQIGFMDRLSQHYNVVISEFTSITFGKSSNRNNFIMISTIMTTTIVACLFNMNLLFGSYFTTDVTIAEKDFEIKSYGMLKNLDFKHILSASLLCNPKRIPAFYEIYQDLEKRGLLKSALESPTKTYNIYELLISHAPGKIIFTLEISIWPFTEWMSYNYHTEYYKKHYLYHSSPEQGVQGFHGYSRERLTLGKVRLFNNWVQGLFEMGLNTKTISKAYYDYLVKNFIVPDQFKSLYDNSEAAAINFPFFRPSFIFLALGLSTSAFVLILELMIHKFC